MHIIRSPKTESNLTTSELFTVSASDEALVKLSRKSLIKVKVTVFDKSYNLIPPTNTLDSNIFSFEVLEPYLEMCALPGGTAASFTSSDKSLIQELYELNRLPDEESLYGLSDYCPKYASEFKSIFWLELDDLFFNDGSLRIVKTTQGYKLFDYPNCILQSKNTTSSTYLSKDRVLIGTDTRGKNIAVKINANESVYNLAQFHDISIGLSASPLLVVDNKVLSIQDVLCNQFVGDPRHYIRIPYTNRGPVLLQEFTNLFRYDRGKDVFEALGGKTITIQSGKPVREKVDEIIHAFKCDKAYGEEFDIRYSETENTWILPYLLPAVYNHLLFGLSRKGEFILIQTGGRVGNVTGQEGLDLGELIMFLEKIRDEYQIEHLWTGSQGRDADNVVTGHKFGSEFRIHDHTRGGEFNMGDPYNRGQVTSSRLLLGMK